MQQLCLSDLGFDMQISKLDQLPELSERKSKIGDIFKLGKHFLMCGDTTDEQNYKKLLGNQKIDLVFTDPPYGMVKEKKGVANDNLNSDELLEFKGKKAKLILKN